MKKPPTNVAASVHQRLLNLRDQGAASFDYLQTRFVLERLLYRLSKSKHSDQFILKGAMLFAVWTNQTIRPTRDLDLLGFGDDSADRLKQVFIDICQTPVEPDGLEFDAATVRSDEMFEFSGANLSAALKATFGRRGTPLPSTAPLVLTDEFSKDPMKQQQWSAFLRKTQLVDTSTDFTIVTRGIRDFIMPLLSRMATSSVVTANWVARGPWL